MSVYAVASGKGGVGKTTTAIALAACAGAADLSVVVVDTDLGMADVGTFLGLDDEGPTLHDVLAGEADVDDAIRECDGFDALPTSTDLDGYAAADPVGLRDVVADLRERYDVIVLDAGAGLSHDTVLPLGLADEVVLVSTPDQIAVLDADKTRQIVERIGGTLRGVVFTRAVETDLETLSAEIDGELLGVVPEDDAVGDAIGARSAVPAFAPGSPAGTAYMDIAAMLFELPVTAISFDDNDTTEAGIEDAAVEPFPGGDGGTAAESEDEAPETGTAEPENAGRGDEGPESEGDTAGEAAEGGPEPAASTTAETGEGGDEPGSDGDTTGGGENDTDDAAAEATEETAEAEDSGGFLSWLFRR